jgi:hypothetical protein
MESIDPPDYPAAPGLSMPDLNLANPMNAVASTYGINVLPDPVKPPLLQPTLNGNLDDIARMGVDGAQGTLQYELNLAGVQGVPAPASLAEPFPAQGSNAPTFLAPDFSTPGLKPYDLVGPGITYSPEFQADPALPDLTEYEHPRGLQIGDNSLLAVDPQLADLLQYDNPMGLSITHHPLLPDPLVPDLQNPDLEQQTEMPADERPGDLDPSALTVMDPATSAQVAEKDYPEVFMDQSGMNNTRSRHMTLLMDGLRDEEKRR